ncbi:MAG: zf-HC2 domain-containing protein [Gemmataceae bacterium]|nr:zf-HC2 domain-containing protein [Gemmataceae bacterium]
MTLSCRRASVLISAAKDRKLSPRERISLLVHLLICSSCRRFARQLEKLRDVARSLLADLETQDVHAAALSVEARARIRHALGEP